MENLAAKYRPSTFSDVCGQSIIVDILKNLCSKELQHRNFLFIGPAGCGKTTLARIIGKTLNDGKDAAIEIDAASHSGVDSVRELVKQASTYPIGANYKIFIIDECHALSSASWQALLLTIEEQPAKSVFIFCTTNPEKIPATILSRVQVFRVSKLSLDTIVSRLKHIIDAEIGAGCSYTYTEDAVIYLAKLAGGGMRDAITLLEKSLSYSKDITIENLVQSLNLPDYADYFLLLQAVASKNNTAIADIIHRVYNSGVNFVTWFEGFHGFVINIVKYIFLQDVNKTMIPAFYSEKLSKYTTPHATLCLKLANILIKLNYELKSTTYQQELALTYLCSTK